MPIAPIRERSVSYLTLGALSTIHRPFLAVFVSFVDSSRLIRIAALQAGA